MGKSVRYRGIDLHSGRRGWGMGLSLLAPFHLIRLLVEVELMVAAEKNVLAMTMVFFCVAPPNKALIESMAEFKIRVLGAIVPREK